MMRLQPNYLILFVVAIVVNIVIVCFFVAVHICSGKVQVIPRGQRIECLNAVIMIEDLLQIL